MKQKTHDTGGPSQDQPDTSSDGVLKDLAAKAKALAPALDASATGDPRRRGEIEIDRDLGSDDIYCLLIDGVMWVEIEYDYTHEVWCIQDCMGKCLEHVEHTHAKVPGNHGKKGHWPAGYAEAIEKGKQMIRDGSMPSPEEAKATFDKNHKKKKR